MFGVSNFNTFGGPTRFVSGDVSVTGRSTDSGGSGDRPTANSPIPDSRLVGSPTVLSPTEAAEYVPERATLLVSGFGGVGYPKRIPEAIATSDPRDLTVVSGGGVGPEIDDRLVESGDLRRRYPFQTQQAVREAINEGVVAFHDSHISHVADELRFGGLRRGMVGERIAIVEAVAVGEDWLVPSMSSGNTPAFVEVADHVLVELNRAQPVEIAALHDVYRRSAPPDREVIPLADPLGTIGDPRVDFDSEKLVGIVEVDRPDDPYTFRAPGPAEKAVAANLREFLAGELEWNPLFETAVTLQFGVGSMGNALMGEISGLDFAGRDVVYFGEVIQDGLLELFETGAMRGASATSLALSAAGRVRFLDSIEHLTDRIVLRPGDISNDAGVIDRFGVVGINSAVEVDLNGNANATHLDGRNIVNGIGGGGDFARNSLLGIIALPSTAAGGDISRVVPKVPHVDHTEHDVSVVVTEHGVADLRGCSPSERARKLVTVAAPRYREDLRRYLERADDIGGNTPFEPGHAFDWRTDVDGG